MINPSPNQKKTRTFWDFTPPLPIHPAPFFDGAVSLRASLLYFFNVWRPFGFRFLLLLVSFAIWIWFTPDLERVREFRLDWMLEVGLRNLVIVITVAGGLHLYLFTFKGQGDDQRYYAKPLATKSSNFHFNNQVLDNMFWTLCSSVPIGTLFECAVLWGYANGYGTLITFSQHPVWFVVLVFLVPIWSGFHFYVYHRLLHVEPLYRWFHSWHHKNVNTGPWSGHAMHPVEHVGLYSDLLIYLFIASHPVHVIFNTMLHTIGGPTSHCGFEKVKIVGSWSLTLGDFMHQLHHRFINCNYGTNEIPLDKAFGSFHDGTAQGDQEVVARRRKKMEPRPQK